MSNKLKLKTGNIRSDRFNYLLKHPQKVEEALLLAGLRMERTEAFLIELIKDNVVLEHGNKPSCAMLVSLCNEFGIDINKTKEQKVIP